MTNKNRRNLNTTLNYAQTSDGQPYSVPSVGVSATSSFDELAPTTTNGDLIVFSGSTNIRIPVGGAGQALVVDAASPGGIKWDNVAGVGSSVTGSTNFFVTSLLKASGTITNPVGNLILSSTEGSIVYVSGALNMASFTYIDSRYPSNSTFNTFTASQVGLNASLNGFTASFSSSVQSIGDARYAQLTTYGAFTSSINTFSSSINEFSASVNSFTASIVTTLDGRYIFTSSISTQLDVRYYTTASTNFDTLAPTSFNGDLIAFSGSVSIRKGSGSNGDVLTVDSTAPGGIAWSTPTAGAVQVTGATNFFVTNELNVYGAVENVSGALTLSSSAQSVVVSSASLTVKHVGAYTIGTADNHLIFLGNTQTPTNNISCVSGGLKVSLTPGLTQSLDIMSGTISRVTVNNRGRAAFTLNDATSEVGFLTISTPSSVPGFSILDSSNLQRTDIRHYQAASSGGIIFAAHSGTGAPPNILAILGGGFVEISGVLDFNTSAANYHIKADNSHLILSSSAGSTVYVSGNLTVRQDIAATGGFKHALSGWQRNNQAANVKFEMSGVLTTPSNIYYFVAPFAGSIVGLSARECNGTSLGGGNITFSASINGTASSTAILNIAAGSSGTTTFAKDAIPFQAGDRLGVYIATVGGYTPTTMDWYAWLTIEM